MKLRQATPLARSLFAASTVIVLIVLASLLLPASGLATNVATRNALPSLEHPFGADWLGRDMLTRTMVGLRLSLALGAATAAMSTVIAVIMGVLAGMGNKWLDATVGWFIDLFISMPHLVFMVLLAFLAGGGMKGILIAVGLTHWPSLARIIRAEVLKVRSSDYIAFSRNQGMSGLQIAWHHLVPIIIPQALVGMLLMFPHVILHESALTFLGFGLSPQTPSLGIILSEGLRNISAGQWWLVLLPTICLIVVVRLVDRVGENLKGGHHV